MPRGSNQYKKYFHVLPDKPNGYNHLGICIACKSSNININELKITLTKKTCRNHLLNCKLFQNNFSNEEEWLNWVAANDTETIIENELYDNDEGFINTSSNETNNLQNLSTPNKKRLLGMNFHVFIY